MKKLVTVLCSTLLSSCASYIAIEELDTEHRDKENSDKISDYVSIPLYEALAIDMCIASATIKRVKEELPSNPSNDASPSYQGEDSNMCEEDQVKVCTINDGCMCRN